MLDPNDVSLQLPPDWRSTLAAGRDMPDLAALEAFLASEDVAGTRVFPQRVDRFRALQLTPFDRTRVVILGQDPYHGEGQAHGLAFSVPRGVKTPPSLANIYKELHADLGVAPARHGFLEAWARQGVLLLNTVLTVRMGAAGSHQKRGWEQVTDAIIRAVAAKDRPVVFMLWGAHAQKKAALVEAVVGAGRHLILRAPHPSPLSAYAGFFGSRHFSQANAFLERHGMAPIEWALPD